jgi:hypothetical protein
MSNGENASKNKEREEKEKNDNALNRFMTSVRVALVDLTTLEVNSVLVSNISADHPIEDIEFLNQTCESLSDWFDSNKTDNRVQRPLNDDKDGCLSILRALCSLSHKDKWSDIKGKISRLRVDNDACLKDKKDNLDAEQIHKRSEYRRHLRYLNKYLNLLESCFKEQEKKKEVLTDRERQQLRKLWELTGTTFIYAQTVLQLDGDIISRINDQLFSTASENAEELMRLHNWNVNTGVNYRNGVMDTFVQILRMMIG